MAVGVIGRNVVKHFVVEGIRTRGGTRPIKHPRLGRRHIFTHPETREPTAAHQAEILADFKA